MRFFDAKPLSIDIPPIRNPEPSKNDLTVVSNLTLLTLSLSPKTVGNKKT